MRHFDIIRKPIITEKSMQLVESNNSYTFEVDRKANKVEIKKAIEEIFGVTVVSVKQLMFVLKRKEWANMKDIHPHTKKLLLN